MGAGPAKEHDRVIDPEQQGRLQRPFLLQDPEFPVRRARLRRMVVIAAALVVLSAVAATVTQSILERRETSQGYVHWMQRDLTRLREAQDDFHMHHDSYGTLSDLGPAYVPSQGVTVRLRADSTGWSAVAAHVRSATRCIMSVGIGASALLNLPSGEAQCR